MISMTSDRRLNEYSIKRDLPGCFPGTSNDELNSRGEHSETRPIHNYPGMTNDELNGGRELPYAIAQKQCWMVGKNIKYNK